MGADGNWVRVDLSEDYQAFRYLPKMITNTKHLEHEGGNLWRVVDGSGKKRNLAYRCSENLEDKDPHRDAARLNTVVHGLAKGNWIRVELSDERMPICIHESYG